MRLLPIDEAAISVVIDVSGGLFVTMAWQWKPLVHSKFINDLESLARILTWSHPIIEIHFLSHALETLGAQLLFTKRKSKNLFIHFDGFVSLSPQKVLWKRLLIIPGTP